LVIALGREPGVARSSRSPPAVRWSLGRYPPRPGEHPTLDRRGQRSRPDAAGLLRVATLKGGGVQLGQHPLGRRGRSAVPMGTLTRSTGPRRLAPHLKLRLRRSTRGDRRSPRPFISLWVTSWSRLVSDVTVVGYANSPEGASAMQAVDPLGPNAVLLEIQLPVTEGLDTIRAL
jgi:hypothetical protein